MTTQSPDNSLQETGTGNSSPSTRSFLPKTCRSLALIVGCTILGAASGSGTSPLRADSPDQSWKAGLASVRITPEKPMWMSGYGSRNKPANATINDLYAKVAVLEDPNGTRAVFISTDLISVPIKMAQFLEREVKTRFDIPRERLMITCSHTHSGPALDDKLTHMLDMKEKDWKVVRAYSAELNRKLVTTIEAAIKDLKPAVIATGNGTTDFAVNRRPPIGEGPVDHDVPVISIRSPDDQKLRGVIFGYACHNTVLSGYEWCGDYAGFATGDLEDRNPGCIALFHTGCGADQNPLPRRKVELAQKYGRMLSQAVTQVLESEMAPVSGRLEARYENIDLKFDTLPSPETVMANLKSDSHFERNRAANLMAEIMRQGELSQTHAYPVQVWQLGRNITWIALGGEIVVDYSLRLKKELGGDRTWVTGYANHVMAYIPSERVLKEGGYEGGRSMLYYQLPAHWAPGLEDQIVSKVHELAGSRSSTRD